MHKQLKRYAIGIVGSLAIFWAFAAHAWSPTAYQRGWVDNMTWYQGFAPGPSWPLTVNGWACLNPSSGASSDPTSVEVYQNTTQGWRLLPIVGKSFTYRPDVVWAGACSSYYSGFSVGVTPVLPVHGGYNMFRVDWLVGDFRYTLEGTTQAVVYQ